MKIKGIVINNNDYQDNTKIVNILTENGLLTTQVCGFKKPNSKLRSGFLDGTILEVEILDGYKKNIVTGYNLIQDSAFLIRNYDGLVFINFLKEIIYKISLEEEYSRIYPIVLEALTNIKDGEEYKNTILKYMSFIYVNTLCLIGYNPIAYVESLEDDTEFKILINELHANKCLKNIKDYKSLLSNLNAFLLKFTNIEIKSIQMI